MIMKNDNENDNNNEMIMKWRRKWIMKMKCENEEMTKY